MITTRADAYTAALEAYLLAVLPNPDIFQSQPINTKLDALDLAEKTFIESFEGLGIINDFSFGTDSRNNDFNAKRVASSLAKASLKANQSSAIGFFTNPSTATAFAEYLVAAINVSNRIKSGV